MTDARGTMIQRGAAEELGEVAYRGIEHVRRLTSAGAWINATATDYSGGTALHCLVRSWRCDRSSDDRRISRIPSAPHMIRPYAADVFPELFADPSCPVVAIAAERTFWEKATILHQQAHRTGVMPRRYSRHYYDLHRLAHSPVKDAAMHAWDLLRDVVEFKQRFYPCGWANYERARPGTFKLMPSSHRSLPMRGMKQLTAAAAP